jgi:hypothetical protein
MASLLDLLPHAPAGVSTQALDIGSDGSRERFCFDPQAGNIVLLDIVGDEPPVVCASTLTGSSTGCGPPGTP